MSLEKDHSISLIYQKYLYYFHSDLTQKMDNQETEVN